MFSDTESQGTFIVVRIWSFLMSHEFSNVSLGDTDTAVS